MARLKAAGQETARGALAVPALLASSAGLLMVGSGWWSGNGQTAVLGGVMGVVAILLWGLNAMLSREGPRSGG